MLLWEASSGAFAAQAAGFTATLLSQTRSRTTPPPKTKQKTGLALLKEVQPHSSRAASAVHRRWVEHVPSITTALQPQNTWALRRTIRSAAKRGSSSMAESQTS